MNYFQKHSHIGKNKELGTKQKVGGMIFFAIMKMDQHSLSLRHLGTEDVKLSEEKSITVQSHETIFGLVLGVLM